MRKINCLETTIWKIMQNFQFTSLIKNPCGWSICLNYFWSLDIQKSLISSFTLQIFWVEFLFWCHLILDLKIATWDQNKSLFEQNNVMILLKFSKFWFQWNSLGCFKALSNILLHPTHLPTCIFFFSFLKFKKKKVLLLNFASMKKLAISFYSIIFATLKPSKPAKYTPPMFFFFFQGKNFSLLQI